MYGFIMELIFVTAARIGFLDYGSAFHLVLMIIGMNATWGAIDAVIFYLIGLFSERHHAKVIDAARGSGDREEAVEYLLKAFGGTPLDALLPEDERMICERILDCRTEDAEGMSKNRRSMALSSLGCFIITLLTVIPVALPILLIHDTVLALGIASALSSAILFFVGYSMKPKMNGDLALHRSSCPSAGRFDHQTGSGWQAHPRFKMFMAALISRSMIRPQPGQLCTLTLRSFFTTRPHPEHICDVPLGSTSAIPRRALAATSAILVRILPMEASLYWFVILLERDLDLSCSTLRSSMTIPS